jgi:hypothetical protein
MSFSSKADREKTVLQAKNLKCSKDRNSWIGGFFKSKGKKTRSVKRK